MLKFFNLTIQQPYKNMAQELCYIDPCKITYITLSGINHARINEPFKLDIYFESAEQLQNFFEKDFICD